jgi:hypothetical protein
MPPVLAALGLVHDMKTVRFALAGLVLGLATGYFISTALPVRYSSAVILRLSDPPAGAHAVGAKLIRTVDHALNHEELKAVIRDERLYGYKGDLDTRSLNGLAHRLRLAIQITPEVAASTTFRLAFEDRDRANVQRTLERLTRLVLASPGLELVRPATPPTAVRSRMSVRLIFGGAAIGLGLGALLARRRNRALT